MRSETDVQMSFAEYKRRFMDRRKAFLKVKENRNKLTQYQDEWVEEALRKLDDTAISIYNNLINSVTTISRDNLLSIMMDVETKVGTTPLLYASDISKFAKTKTYLTGLFEKVRNRKNNIN